MVVRITSKDADKNEHDFLIKRFIPMPRHETARISPWTVGFKMKINDIVKRKK